jgi:hypothetical protein
MCVEMIGMVNFKRGKKYATILMARVALKVIVLSYTSAVNVDRPITRFLPIRMSESLQTKERLKRLFINDQTIFQVKPQSQSMSRV